MTNHTDLLHDLRATTEKLRRTPLPIATVAPLLAKAADALQAAQAEIANLHTVMMAAAVEISEHWDAHCDAEGYGPVNLLRRLENGYPERYGYDSHTVVRMEKERDAAKAEIAAVRKANIDCVNHFDALRIDYDQALARLAEIEAGASPVQPANEQRGEVPTAPAHCPITGRKFWGNIDHPELGVVATYGGPFDTYTIPAIGEDGELRCERFDQDAGNWVDGGEPAGWFCADQPDVQPSQGLQSVADALTIEQLNEKVDRLMAVQPSQAQAALDAIIWYYENCTGSDSSISAFRQMVDRVVKMRPNFCESCAMDIATCDCVTPRPATVTVQPSQAGEVSKQDIYDIAHRKATRYVCTAAPYDVMYGFSEMHLLDFVAAINAKGSK